ncbi:hypothetical protein ABZ649_04780 [Streptomyces albidoflavus]|uniref:hypothetical protein n=1 Tax=Streptomyces albidoflavus TaxID=1886 RepID=UPI00340BF74D
MTTRTPIAENQTYRALDPRSTTRLRIERYTPGSNRAWVVDALTGKRGRYIQVTALHDSATTRDGSPRRGGYLLETAPAKAQPNR